MIDFFADARAFINSPEDSASPSVDYKRTTPKEFKPTPKPDKQILYSFLGSGKLKHILVGIVTPEAFPKFSTILFGSLS